MYDIPFGPSFNAKEKTDVQLKVWAQLFNASLA